MLDSYFSWTTIWTIQWCFLYAGVFKKIAGPILSVIKLFLNFKEWALITIKYYAWGLAIDFLI